MTTLPLAKRVELNYQVDGAGETCFLLFNGAGLPLEFWGSLATRLSESAQVIRFDQRNAGATHFEGEFTLNDIAADAANLVVHLGVESVIAVGHAWGGRVAQVFARDYPHLVQKQVICGTGGQFPPVDMSTVQLELREARRDDDRKSWEKLLARLYCGTGFMEREPDLFRQIADVIWNSRANSKARWDSQASPSASYWGTARVPTLLVYGEEDKNGTPKNARDLHERIEGSRLEMLPGAGHFVVREEEAKVLALLLEFAG
ncbi:MAG: alpha/beta hydrolase [Pseudomonadales bacterium]